MTDCGVCIGGWDGEPAELYVERIVKARKPHKCHECERVIAVGEKYERVTGKWEGEMERYSFCITCSEIHRIFSCGEGRTFGTLWDDMGEMVFPELTTSNKCFLKLSPPSKEVLLSRWREWKGLRVSR